MKVPIYDTKAAEVGTEDLDDSIFQIEPNVAVMHQAHVRQAANKRLGTHDTKTRAQVRGGGRKPWRQKGTGRARQGTTRAPQWAGGGAVFGPVPRSHEHALPKKARRAALRGALSCRLQEGAVTVVESLEIDGYSTKRVVEILKGLGLGGEKVLFVIGEASPTLERSARNLHGVDVLRAEGLNVYDVLRHAKLVMTRAGLEAVEKRLASAQEGAA